MKQRKSTRPTNRITCPPWCTSHLCDGDLEHRHVVEDRWTVPSDDVEITIAASRVDEIPPWTGQQLIGADWVRLALVRTRCATLAGAPVAVAVSLDATSARLLARLLHEGADVIDLPKRRTRCRTQCVECSWEFDLDSSPHPDRCWSCAERAAAEDVDR